MTKACRRRLSPNTSGARRASDIRLIVLHSTEGGTAASVAAWFASRRSGASTQLVVDDAECYRCVPDLVIPWGAPGANRSGIHIEHCGYARWTRAQWEQHGPMLERSAAKAAVACWQFRIPRRYLTLAELRAGRRGFVFHSQCSAAFPPNAGHHDPGPGFPQFLYMQHVRRFYEQLARERAGARET